MNVERTEILLSNPRFALVCIHFEDGKQESCYWHVKDARAMSAIYDTSHPLGPPKARPEVDRDEWARMHQDRVAVALNEYLARRAAMARVSGLEGGK